MFNSNKKNQPTILAVPFDNWAALFLAASFFSAKFNTLIIASSSRRKETLIWDGLVRALSLV